MFNDFDRDTRAAILHLYRSVGDREEIEREAIATLRPREFPALVIWGRDDPYLSAGLAERQREAFPSAEVHLLEDSGHWPFVDRPECVEGMLVDFLTRVHDEAALHGSAVPA